MPWADLIECTIKSLGKFSLSTMISKSIFIAFDVVSYKTFHYKIYSVKMILRELYQNKLKNLNYINELTPTKLESHADTITCSVFAKTYNQNEPMYKTGLKCTKLYQYVFNCTNLYLTVSTCPD